MSATYWSGRVAGALLVFCLAAHVSAQQVTLQEDFAADPVHSGLWDTFEGGAPGGSGALRWKQAGQQTAEVTAPTKGWQYRVGLISRQPVASAAQLTDPKQQLVVRLTFGDDMIGTGYNQPVTRLTLASTAPGRVDPYGTPFLDVRLTLRPSPEKVRDALAVDIYRSGAAGKGTLADPVFLTAADGKTNIRCGKDDVLELVISPTHLVSATYLDASASKTTPIIAAPIAHGLDFAKEFSTGARLAVSHWSNLNDGATTSSTWSRIEATVREASGSPKQ